jgi:hypothetical protein
VPRSRIQDDARHLAPARFHDRLPHRALEGALEGEDFPNPFLGIDPGFGAECAIPAEAPAGDGQVRRGVVPAAMAATRSIRFIGA